MDRVTAFLVGVLEAVAGAEQSDPGAESRRTAADLAAALREGRVLVLDLGVPLAPDGATDGAVPAAWHAIPELVSSISEDLYAAGWLVDAEFEVWRMLRRDPGAWTYAEDPALVVRVAALRALAEQTGLWVRRTSEEPFVVPVPLAKWEPAYAAWVERQAEARARYEASRCGAPTTDGQRCRLEAGHAGAHDASALDALAASRGRRRQGGDLAAAGDVAAGVAQDESSRDAVRSGRRHLDDATDW